MFTWLNKQGVESDRGFAVQVLGRFTIEYREGTRRISVEVEPGMKDGVSPCFLIEPTAFQRWDGDPEGMALSQERQQTIASNFREAMEFMAVSVVVEPRFP